MASLSALSMTAKEGAEWMRLWFYLLDGSTSLVAEEWILGLSRHKVPCLNFTCGSSSKAGILSLFTIVNLPNGLPCVSPYHLSGYQNHHHQVTVNFLASLYIFIPRKRLSESISIASNLTIILIV